MNIRRIQSKRQKGFSLIEVLIVVFIIAVAFTSFYSVATVGTKYIIESKNRLGAVAFVNEKVEILRNLKYADVGIVGGIPNGKIPQDEDVNANGRFFHVRTYVQYIDDPLDGVFPVDVISNDYKLARVVVSWKDSNGSNQEVVSIARFVPPGLETSDGGAPLAINVKGGDGVAVKQALVNIVNNAVTPALNFNVQTDDEGHIMIPAAPESLANYHISVSKSGYETVSTMDSPVLDYKSEEYTPTYTHAGVLLDTLNMYDYIQDKLSNLTIKTADYQNNPVGNLSFSIDGGKVLGRDALNVNVTNMHEADVTDSVTGQVIYSAISPGNYKIILNEDAQYVLADHFPAGNSLALIPGVDLTYEMKVVDKTIDGLLVKVTDSLNPDLVVDAKISLFDNLGVEIFSNKAVSASGIAYYPDGTVPLPAGAYKLKIEAVDYVTQEIDVTIDKLTSQNVLLVKVL